MKKAFITGICGQDGSYLAEFLIRNRYEVVGLYRRSSSPNFSRLKNIKDHKNLKLVEGDITDYTSLFNIISKENPHEIYHLAAQSHVASSFSQPFYTTQADYLSVLNILEIMRHMKTNEDLRPIQTKLYFAGTSEMFGSASDIKQTVVSEDFTNNTLTQVTKYTNYQNENTIFVPQSPYAIAKLAGYHACRLYRECYGLYACTGILFNHESPRRGEEFVTKKIVKYFKNLNRLDTMDKLFAPKLKLGNLDAQRDWGYAAEYVEAMWCMLQQKTPKPQDFVIGTGETHSVREFIEEVGKVAQINDIFSYIEIDPKFTRPAEVNYLCADASKAKAVLGWTPKTKFSQLVQIMYANENG